MSADSLKPGLKRHRIITVGYLFQSIYSEVNDRYPNNVLIILTKISLNNIINISFVWSTSDEFSEQRNRWSLQLASTVRNLFNLNIGVVWFICL